MADRPVAGQSAQRPGWHRAIGVAAALLWSVPALAQSDCATISDAIARIEASPIHRNFLGAGAQADLATTRLGDARDQFERAGCHIQLQSGGLDAACTAFSHAVLSAQADRDAIERQLADAATLAREHGALVAAYNGQDCGRGNGVTFSRSDGSAPDMRSLLEIRPMTPSSPGFLDAEPLDLRGTRRTLCVRSCDGAYWPVSYATTEAYFAQDAQTCHAQCPGAETALYSHATNGEDVSDMVSVGGLRYERQPFAFAFRNENAPQCSCDLQEAGLADVGISGRFASPPLSAADLVDVPLPLPRPAFPSEAPSEETAEAGTDIEDLRLYQSGDRLIRIVGPVTAYTPEAQEGP